MSYNGKGYMLGGFFDGIGNQDAAEALAEATIDHIDNAAFRDMYMDTMNEALTNGIDYLEKYDEEGNYVKENLDDALLEMGADPDLDLNGPEPGPTSESADEWENDAVDVDEYGDCEEASIREAIRKLPDGDPAEAGTYFSLVNRVNAEEDPEAQKAIKEQLDMVSAYIPDTNIVAEDATAPITNQLNFSNNRDACVDHYNKRTSRVKTAGGNDLVQPEAYIDQQKQVGEAFSGDGYDVNDMAALEDFYAAEGFMDTLKQLQASRANVSPEQQRLQQKVAQSQNAYDRFQNMAAGDPKNVDKYRQQMGQMNLASTNNQIQQRMAQDAAAQNA